MVSIRTSAGVAIALLAVAAPAGAHIGASVAKAAYLHPVTPPESFFDGSTRADFSAYVPESADTVYHIDWTDGDIDPTGRFTFYYLDHLVSDGYSAADVEKYGTHVVDVKGREATTIWTACTCALDAGVTCPDLGDGGVRWCDDFVDWDVSQIPDGSYWIYAVNHDPPFYVYNPSSAPVRIVHDKKPPPVVLVEFPDGLGHANNGYYIEVIAIGTGTMKLDLAWGDNSDMNSVLGPVTTIAKGLPVVVASDGLTGYQWDTSQLPDLATYFVRATLTDDNGQSYSDSRYPLSVFHDGSDGGFVPPDLSAAADDAEVLHVMPPQTSCACAVGGRPRPAPTAVGLLLLAALASRRARRPCSRSGCTG